MTEGWNTFLPPIKRPGTGDYLIGHTDREQWYVLPPDAERANLETLKPMPKVDEENQDWMLPERCTSDGTRLVGAIFRSRKSPTEPLAPIGIGIFNFETNMYKVLPTSTIELD